MKLNLILRVFISTLVFLTITQAYASVQPSQDEPVRTISEWDLDKKKLAVGGYDPVAYFPEGGSKATKGNKKITTTYKGVVYRFANEKNREQFLKSPTKYEPAHGGWCSWAMTTGDKTEPNPKTFIVKDGRLYLFYNGLLGNTKKSWEKGNHESLAAKADQEWKSISGELPRIHGVYQKD